MLDVVDDDVELAFELEPVPVLVPVLVPLPLVPPPSGVAPPLPDITDVPPVAGAPGFDGIVTVVVDVVTVIGIVADAEEIVGATDPCGRTAGAITVGAASSGGSTLAVVSWREAGGTTWWVRGADSAARAW